MNGDQSKAHVFRSGCCFVRVQLLWLTLQPPPPPDGPLHPSAEHYAQHTHTHTHYWQGLTCTLQPLKSRHTQTHIVLSHAGQSNLCQADKSSFSKKFFLSSWVFLFLPSFVYSFLFLSICNSFLSSKCPFSSINLCFLNIFPTFCNFYNNIRSSCLCK